MNREERRRQKIRKPLPKKETTLPWWLLPKTWAVGSIIIVLIVATAISFSAIQNHSPKTKESSPAQKDPLALPDIKTRAYWGANYFDSDLTNKATVYLFFDPKNCDALCQKGVRGVASIMHKNPELNFILFAQSGSNQDAIKFAQKAKWSKSVLIMDTKHKVFDRVNASKKMPSAIFVSADNRRAGMTTTGAGGTKGFETGFDEVPL